MTTENILKDLKVVAREKGCRRIKFEAIRSEEGMNDGIEVMELPTRAYNSLKSIKVNTVGDLVDRIQTTSDLEKIHGCGAKSRREIMTSLLSYVIKQNIEHERDPLTGISLS